MEICSAMSDFATVKVSDWENHFIITPHQITIVKAELLEFPQLPVLRKVWIPRLAQKRLEIHDSNYSIIEGQTNLVIRNVSCLRNLQIVCRSRFHFSFLLMISGLLCFLSTKKSTHRCTMSLAFALTNN